jgi:hypothetical protein
MSDERPLTAEQGWPHSDRYNDMCRVLDRALQGGWLHVIRPGFLAGTYGVTKDEVKEELRRRNEVAGSAK